MARVRAGWITWVVAALGGIVFALGLRGLMTGLTLWDSLVTVLGFLILSWAALDYRRYRRGTPESEVEGGHTIE